MGMGWEAVFIHANMFFCLSQLRIFDHPHLHGEEALLISRRNKMSPFRPSAARRLLLRRLTSCTTSPDGSSPTSSLRTFDLAVKRLVESRQFSNIEPLVESYKKMAPAADGDRLLASIVSACGRARMLDHAIQTFEQLECCAGAPRSVLAFNAVLSACTTCRAYDKVPILFSKLAGKHAVVPNEVSYGILIKSHCESGSPDSALQALDEMKGRKLEANMVIYTTILDGLYKKGMVEDAERVWSEMIEIGDGPDVAAYNVRIMHAHGGKPGEVLRLINEMLFVGLKPDVTSYNYLMTCFCKHGVMEEAKKVYGGMQGDVCRANGSTFRVFLFYLCRSGDLDMALEVFKVSVKRNRMPNYQTVKPLVVGLVLRKKMREAKEVIELAKKKSQEYRLSAWKTLEVELGLDELEYRCTCAVA